MIFLAISISAAVGFTLGWYARKRTTGKALNQIYDKVKDGQTKVQKAVDDNK